MTDFTAPLSIELDGLTIDTEATFAIDAEWDGRHLIEARATLLTWRCDDRDLPRASLVKLLNALVIDGEKRVLGLEDTAAGDWCATAERDARDNHADSRAWAAE